MTKVWTAGAWVGPDPADFVSQSDLELAISGNLWRPTAALYDTYPRFLGGTNAGTLGTGIMKLVAIWFPEGATISSITWLSGTTALGSGTHLWSALYDSSRNLLRQSADDTSPVWASNSAKTFTLTSPYVTTYSGFHYIGIMVAATTVPSLICHAPGAGVSNVFALPVSLVGNSGSGLLATAPNPATISSVSIVLPYAYVS